MLDEIENSNIDIFDIGIVSTLSIIFIGLCSQFFWFTLDDAYITLRYSKHLAEGSGIVWNIGSDPVEGYTSFLWMIIGAIPHAVGIPPVLFMKLLGVSSTVLTIVLLYGYGRYRSIDRWLLAVGAGQIAVSPAVSVLSIQGMETTTAMFLVLFISIAAIELIREYRTGWAVAMNLTLFLGMLVRPDLVIFGVLLEAGIAGLLYRQDRISDLKRLIVIGFLLVFVPGVVYMLSRYWYFGYLLPNPFYIKSGLSVGGPITVFEFVMLITGPLLFVTLMTEFLRARSREMLINMSPLALSITGFLGLYLFITPIQGYLYRFQVPVLAAMLLVLLLLLSKSTQEIKGTGLPSKSIARVAVAALLISGLFVYPLFTVPMAVNETNKRTRGDRVVMGQALESLEDEDYKMFITESGAIPYYSEWESVDELGLNNEQIAHRGLTQQFLTNYRPDVVQMIISGTPGMIRAKSPETASFLDDSPYSLVAVVHKQNADKTNVAPDRFHVYFVNTESEGYHNIACTVLTQDLKYANRSVVTQQAAIDVQVANLTASDCNGINTQG